MSERGFATAKNINIARNNHYNSGKVVIDKRNSELLTPGDVAKQLQVHRSTIIRYCQDQMIECYAIKRGSRATYRFTPEMIGKFLRQSFKKVAIWNR